MKNLVRVIRWIFQQPLNRGSKQKALMRFLFWQINHYLNPFPVITPWVNGAKLILKHGMSGATGNLYAGLHDFEEMSFLLHLLRREDMFFDIGANIGSYTVLASSAIGCKSVAVEPIPSTYKYLKDNIVINEIEDRANLFNIALGSIVSKLQFTAALDTENHVAIEGEKDTIEVDVEKLDTLVERNSCPLLMKIDVEGFETDVLRGGALTLANENLKAVMIEMNGCGLRYGYKDEDIHSMLLSAGFLPYAYDPFTRTLTLLSSWNKGGNTIYARDFAFICKRLQEATAYTVLEKSV